MSCKMVLSSFIFSSLLLHSESFVSLSKKKGNKVSVFHLSLSKKAIKVSVFLLREWVFLDREASILVLCAV